MTSNKPLHALFAGFLFLVAIACVGTAAAQAWTQLAPNGGPPAAREGHSAVFNTTGDRMVVFGGINGGYFNDTWVLSHADGVGGTPTWDQFKTEGSPPARYGHAAVYDPASNAMIVFGGGNEGYLNDTWVLSHADGTGGTPSWTQQAPATSPSARIYHSAIYNATTQRMVVFGGAGPEGSLFNDVWMFTGGNWTQLSPTGTPPSARYAHTAVYDPASNSMVVFGGYNGNVLNDTWMLSHADGTGGTPAWIQLSPTGTPPPARYGHSAVYDPASNSMVVFGGTNQNFLNDTWALSHADGTGGTPAWSQLSPAGTLPLARAIPTAVYDAASNRMIVFGGGDGEDLNDTWLLSDANGVNFVVGLDIQPGIARNNFSLTPGTVVGVAILSSASFNAPTMVDTTTLTFGHTGTEASLMTCSPKPQDMNGDGLKDMVCYFDVVKAGFQHGDTVGYLKGATTLDNGIHGSDVVKINP